MQPERLKQVNVDQIINNIFENRRNTMLQHSETLDEDDATEELQEAEDDDLYMTCSYKRANSHDPHQNMNNEILQDFLM